MFEVSPMDCDFCKKYRECRSKEESMAPGHCYEKDHEKIQLYQKAWKTGAIAAAKSIQDFLAKHPAMVPGTLSVTLEPKGEDGPVFEITAEETLPEENIPMLLEKISSSVKALADVCKGLENPNVNRNDDSEQERS